MIKECNSVIYKQVAPHQGITESRVPHRVLRTVRRVTVTSQRAPVWVVYPDTKALGVINVSLQVYSTCILFFFFKVIHL